MAEFDEQGRPIIDFEAETYPGKFESSGPLGELLYDLSLESWQDDELGDAIEYGLWAALFRNLEVKDKRTGKVLKIHAILSEDSEGFVYVDEYDSQKELMKAWRRLRRDYEDWLEGTGE